MGSLGDDSPLERAVEQALDGLLLALDLRPSGPDRFEVRSEPDTRFTRIYGGQLLAQALVAAGATVTGKEPCSLHAAFVTAGDPDQEIALDVQRVRDGRSMATRQVRVTQADRVLLSAIVSFHANPGRPESPSSPPPGPRPEDLPRLQDHAARLVADANAASWVDRPPPLEIRMEEAPTFLGGAAATGVRSHWMRLPRPVGDDPLLHAAVLAYASDFFLMDVVFRSHPDGAGTGRFGGFSLDHAMWFHRTTRLDSWHQHAQESIFVLGDRGLARGSLHDADGRLVATVMQEVLVRPMVAP